MLDQVRAYKAARDKFVVQCVALEQSKVNESGMSMLPMSLMLFVKVPVALGMFFSVKHLSLSFLSSSIRVTSCFFLVSWLRPILHFMQKL